MPRQEVQENGARPAKRRRSPVDQGSEQTQDQNGASGNSTPQAYGRQPLRKRIRESDVKSRPRARSPLTSSTRPSQPPTEARPPPRSPSRSPPRKRPGAGARIDRDARARIEQQRREREEEERRAISARKNDDLVASHYNAVPQRGREWRKTDSQIRGLRSLNNWVKSAMIQKFSRPDVPVQELLVLDIGCGKGGDLQKWQSAPQIPALYVGIDPADVSVDQARSRYREMLDRRRGPRPKPIFEAHFFAQDCFGRTIGEIPIIQQVGFDPNAGPPGNITGRFMRGGFDVITMMFCLHYSYETEEKARGMLKNVAGALKKGGRFLGVMPNSDVISAHVEKHLKGNSTGIKSKSAAEEPSIYDDETWHPEKPANDDNDDWDPEKPADGGNADDDWDPEKPSNGAASPAWDPEKPSAGADDDNWDPTASLDDPEKENADTKKEASKTPTDLPPLEWGNSKYRVKFPQDRPLPSDGIFRPPYGWKYFFYLEEAVDVPEYVVPWEGLRALAEEYGLELLYRKPFKDVWEEEKNDPVLGPLSERMGVVARDGRSNVSSDEMEAASFYHAFCFYKV
ncbi:hypothetical protein MBLNU457_4248t1 [Dothideomycetes sp. NU457]